MQGFSPLQRSITSEVVDKLAAVPGVRAVAIGGSFSHGRARPESDVDLFVHYSEVAPFAIDAMRALASAVDDRDDPEATDFYGWGRWVNGGAWLVVRGQRIDLVWRNLDQIARVLADAEAGRHEIDYDQQPPFGFSSVAYLGELAACVPVFDPERRLESLKRRVAVYPEALRQALIQDHLWGAEFSLTAFAPRFATRAGAYGTAACLARVVNQLLLVLHAVNRRYFTDDKTALSEIGLLDRVPSNFEPRVQRVLSNLGNSPAEHAAAIDEIHALFRETVALTEGSYRARFAVPE